MTSNDDLGRRLTGHYAWVAPTRAPDWILLSALSTIDDTPQRRVLLGRPWRRSMAAMAAELAVAAVAVAAVGWFGLVVLGVGKTPGVGTSASPLASPFPSPAASPATTPRRALTETFTSGIHGISVSYPAGWTPESAAVPWTSGLPGSLEHTRDTIWAVWSGAPFIGLASQPLAGRTGEEWAADISRSTAWSEDEACDPVPTESITIDGAPGILVTDCPRPLYAMAWTADRGYWVVLYGGDDVDWFREVLATVRLHPEDAVDDVRSPPL